MTVFTLNQASKACDKSKSAILNAIRTGRLSATRNELGRWEIQPCELFRVYPSTTVDYQVESGREEHYLPLNDQTSTIHLLEKIARYEEQLKGVDRLLKQVESERDDLRARLDEESSERRRLSQMLITHQTDIESTKNDQKIDSFFKKLFG